MKKAICADNGVRLVVVTYMEHRRRDFEAYSKTLATCQTADLRGRYLTTVGGLRQLPSQCPRPLVGVQYSGIGSES